MIQDIFPAKFYNHYKEQKFCASDSAFFFSEGKVLARYNQESQSLSFPTWGDFHSQSGVPTYLFSIDNQKYFLMPEKAALSADLFDFSFYTLRQLRDLPLATEAKTSLFAVFSAYHLWKWYDDNKFCGHCGHPLEHDFVERALFCPVCKSKIYPRINPAVIIGILNQTKDKILITKYRTGYAHSALVAGFTEFGETLEQTVEREVMEEVGLKVKNIRYYKSQPWALAQDILAGFFCEVDGDETIRMDEGELKYAEWVSREEVELQPNDYSLTNEMMKLFKSGGSI
ncbi:NAD(+) diphosphatase [Treponema bryantii]|uniref:NAD(+) diphosphatase n=1 Tax=Treponema bryantii TaxID=163 RepID=UPI0003B3306A|nr:NAD(+) diphosphatase [Treponema bryantii]